MRGDMPRGKHITRITQDLCGRTRNETSGVVCCVYSARLSRLCQGCQNNVQSTNGAIILHQLPADILTKRKDRDYQKLLRQLLGNCRYRIRPNHKCWNYDDAFVNTRANNKNFGVREDAACFQKRLKATP